MADHPKTRDELIREMGQASREVETISRIVQASQQDVDNLDRLWPEAKRTRGAHRALLSLLKRIEVIGQCANDARGHLASPSPTLKED